jgi:hypothetical protein
MKEGHAGWSRRDVLKTMTAGGVDLRMSYTEEERKLLLDRVNRLQENLDAIRAIEIDNSVAPA